MSLRDLVAIVRHSKISAASESKSLSWTFAGKKFQSALRALYSSGGTIDFEALRNRSRMAYWDSIQARALLGRLVDECVGRGLELDASPAWELCSPSTALDVRQKWSRDVELRFWLWANSHEPDAAGRFTLGELQRLEFLSRLRDGEVFAVLRYSSDPMRLSPLSIQFYDSAQISLPKGSTYETDAKSRGNRIVDGIEITSTGKEIAIYIEDEISHTYTRMPFQSTTRRTFVLHPAIVDIPGQVRGVGPLAPVVHELEKLTDYETAEIEAALLNAIIVGYILPSQVAPASRALTGGVLPRSGSSTGGSASKSDPPAGEKKFDRPGLWVESLKAGEDLKSFDTKRPNINFDAFIKSITRHISAALSVPIEVFEMSFNANYSASRASLILFWRTVENWRAATASQFLQPIYEAWFAEEIKSGRITAGGYSENSPIIRRSWLATSWIGHHMPSIDPLKEAKADDVRIDQGATTLEHNALKHNGSDYWDNVVAQKREREVLPPPRAQTVTTISDSAEKANPE